MHEDLVVASTPFAYVAAMSLSGIICAFVVHLTGWFLAPERITPFFEH